MLGNNMDVAAVPLYTLMKCYFSGCLGIRNDV